MKSREKLSEYINIFNCLTGGDIKEDLFYGYMDEIFTWNSRVNITAVTDPDEFIKKHFIDSVFPCFMKEFKDAERIADIGTGGGFPGVPLALMFPEKNFILIDSLRKRLKIVDGICEKLGIDNVVTVHGRAEELAAPGSEFRESFDICVSRAVADMAVLSEYCIPFVKTGGFFIAYKTDDEMEIKNAERAVSEMGGKITGCLSPEDILEATGISFRREILPDDRHRLIVTEKVSETPERYPRRAGVPSKNPL